MTHSPASARGFAPRIFTLVPAAIAAGAARIELCDNLAVGGTTPSAGVMERTVDFAHLHDTVVMAMIRPRGRGLCIHRGRAFHHGGRYLLGVRGGC